MADDLKVSLLLLTVPTAWPVNRLSMVRLYLTVYVPASCGVAQGRLDCFFPDRVLACQCILIPRNRQSGKVGVVGLSSTAVLRTRHPVSLPQCLTLENDGEGSTDVWGVGRCTEAICRPSLGRLLVTQVVTLELDFCRKGPQQRNNNRSKQAVLVKRGPAGIASYHHTHL